MRSAFVVEAVARRANSTGVNRSTLQLGGRMLHLDDPFEPPPGPWSDGWMAEAVSSCPRWAPAEVVRQLDQDW